MVRFVSVLLLVVFLVGCGGAAAPTIVPTPDCLTASQSYIGAVDPILRRFDDTVTLAGTTARVSLSGPIGDLQSARRDIDTIAVPDCVKSQHALLLSSMDTTISSFLDFAAQKETRVNIDQAHAQGLRDIYNRAIDEIKSGTIPDQNTALIGSARPELDTSIKAFEDLGYFFSTRSVNTGIDHEGSRRDGGLVEIIEAPDGMIDHVAYSFKGDSPQASDYEEALNILIPELDKSLQSELGNEMMTSSQHGFHTFGMIVIERRVKQFNGNTTMTIYWY